MVATALRCLVRPTIFIASALKSVGGREQNQGSDIALCVGVCVWGGVCVCVISFPNYGLVKGDEGKQEDILRGKGNL